MEFQYYNEKYQDCWLFHCDCGNDKILPAANVKWGRTRSCGCLQREHMANLKKQDITGIRFDRLIALSPTEERDSSGSIIWKCRCDCSIYISHRYSPFLVHTYSDLRQLPQNTLRIIKSRVTKIYINHLLHMDDIISFY